MDLTQRAYTLRLAGLDPSDDSWREALWQTHEAVNIGAKVFGDWLLTFRGGLDHTLADKKFKGRGGKNERVSSDEERRMRRIFLALSWLSVESRLGAPDKFIVATGEEDEETRNKKVIKAFEEILKKRDLSKKEVEEWKEDCKISLNSAIRKDAVWVNRSKAFDEACSYLKGALNREDVWDFLGFFFLSPDTYLAPEKSVDEESTESEQVDERKDFVEKAGQWLSSRFGMGKGADFQRMAEVCKEIGLWADPARAGIGGKRAIEEITRRLSRKGFGPDLCNLSEILSLISGPGYKSATRNLLKKLSEQGTIGRQDLDNLKTKAEKDAQKCEEKVGKKGHRKYADSILQEVEKNSGMTYLADKNGNNVFISDREKFGSKDLLGASRHREFAVMLDHAARRVSSTHTWIKRAEANRRKYEEDANKMKFIPTKIKEWLCEFCENRSAALGASEPYRIRRRAVEGWKEVVDAWSKEGCNTTEDRIASARRLQGELENFGDIELFEALADEDARCVWHVDGDPQKAPSHQLLLDYVAAEEASFNMQRHKVPAYRHPDPLFHPVFCDFGNSRWSIKYSVHEAKKTKKDPWKEVDKRRKEEEKARIAFQCCRGNEEKKIKAGEKLRLATMRMHEAERELEFLASPKRVCMKLWNGINLQEVQMLWRSKRLDKDLAISYGNSGPHAIRVSRADRLGRAAVNASKSDSLQIAGPFEQRCWNGRLQAPREQLARIGRRVERHGWDKKSQMMKRDIKWLLTFSPKLQRLGPWLEYGGREKIKKRQEVEEKGDRGNDARLLLCRLPRLRVLSVDLGHRYAAACAVWETLSEKDFKKEIKGRKVLYGGSGGECMYCHTLHTDREGKLLKTIYRRIGADTLPDGRPHPAPWTRLDRQFLIKLQGEREGAREASVEEIWKVHELEAKLGRTKPLIDRLVAAGWGQTPGQKDRLRILEGLGWKQAQEVVDVTKGNETSYKPSLSVEELMFSTVRTICLALRRHGDRARIAHALTADYKKMPGGQRYYFNRAEDASVGDDESVRHEKHVEYILDALLRWHDLFEAKGWQDEEARELWDKYIANLSCYLEVSEMDDSLTDAELKKRRKDFRDRLRPVAETIVKDGKLRKKIQEEWIRRWERDDEKWREDIRSLKYWIFPRKKQAGPSIYRMGGLSLTRLATMTEFRRKVQVGFFTRLHPDGTTGEVGEDFGRKVLEDLEVMREQRVKQLVSRLVEAALGIGSEDLSHWEGQKRPQQRIEDPRFSPCHAIIIEDLTHYRPDETRTRRENRQLMTWSSSKVKKYLAEACELHGLYLLEVPARYTSRQDSRTGAPGIRCSDVSVAEFKNSPYWRKEVARAKAKNEKNQGDARDRYLCELDAQLAGSGRLKNVRIPIAGGEIFVSADTGSPATKGIQADLNAAANIGLRAIVDPDWPGKWWYVPCDSSSFKPINDRVKGCKVIDTKESLKEASPGLAAKGEKNSEKKKRGRTGHREVVNLWRDISAKPVSAAYGPWDEYSVYWNRVQDQVVKILRSNLALSK
jgi:hypothetical protein